MNKKKGPGLTLDVSDESSDYSVSRSGTFKAQDFAINKAGISVGGSSPAGPSELSPAHGEHVRLEDLERTHTLGAGSSATVFRCIDRATGRVVALKEINVFDEGKRKQIMKELQTLVQASSPHIVQFYGAFYSEGSISIALELMDGGSLLDVLRAVGQVPEDILSKVIAQVLKGLVYLHRERHMVHRDIKPSNLLMNRQGEIKVTDFGVSTELEHTGQKAATFVGTVTYMSPERISGQPYSFAADIWSLGITVFELAVGYFPYSIDSGDGQPRQLMGFWQLLSYIQTEAAPALPADRFSPELCDFVQVCLRAEPEARATSTALQSHPFITKYASKHIDMAAWAQSVVPDMPALPIAPGAASSAQRRADEDDIAKLLSSAQF